MRAIADTSFLMAFANARDHHHAWATALAQEVDEPLLTCEAVLSEAAFHLKTSAVVLDMVHDGLLILAFDAKKHLRDLRQLAARYANRNPDFADLCIIKMSELNPKHAVITVDAKDFGIYRRSGRGVIPLITPTS